jgi:hypothetical protein
MHMRAVDCVAAPDGTTDAELAMPYTGPELFFVTDQQRRDKSKKRGPGEANPVTGVETESPRGVWHLRTTNGLRIPISPYETPYSLL